jgi:hypothetical protein
MNAYTIHTDIWQMSLPADWEERKTTDGKSVYFESRDGTKGLYVATWSLAGDDRRTAEEVAGSFKAADLRALDAMDGYAWQIVNQVNRANGPACVAITDCLATEKCYRSVGKILAAPPLVVKASFHDYACTDYQLSVDYFAPVIDSLRFFVREEDGAEAQG